MSYSQSGEEAAILQACRNAQPHRFLDIGAYHPTKLSNTRALYEAGWAGVMIEPAPAAMLTLLEAYGTDDRVALIQAAVGLEAGLRDFYVSAEAVSTSSTALHDLWGKDGKYVGAMLVPHITLTDLFGQFGGGYGFISIDAEGSSVAICKDLLRLTRETHCICCEWDGDPRELMSLMTAADYALRYSNEENGVWQKMTWEEMHP